MSYDAPLADYSPAPSYTPPLINRATALQWGVVRTGLTLVCVGTIFLAMAVFMVAFLSPANLPADDPMFIILPMVLGLSVMLGCILVLTGCVLCFTAPGGTAAKPGIILHVLFHALAVIGFLSLMGMSMANSVAMTRLRNQPDAWRKQLENDVPFPPAIMTPAVYILQGTGLLAACTYLLFLWGIAKHFQRRALVVILLVFLAIIGLAGIGILALQVAFQDVLQLLRRNAAGEILLGMVVGIELALCCFMFLTLIVRMTLSGALASWQRGKMGDVPIT